MSMNSVQVMVDVETFAQSPNSVICSIGAVKFTRADGIIDQFYCNIDPKDGKRYGLVVEQQTLDWWKKRPKEVLEALKVDQRPLKDALADFSIWFGPKSLPTWACGASFDPVILQSAYEAVGLARPWKFWDDRCYRTFRQLFTTVPQPSFAGDKHNSLDDARHQTLHLLDILRRIYVATDEDLAAMAS